MMEKDSLSRGGEPWQIIPSHYHHSHRPCNANNCKYLDLPKLNCIFPTACSVFYCRPEVWARREAEKIVAARDAAYAEAVAKGETVDEGEDIGDFKPSDMKRIL